MRVFLCVNFHLFDVTLFYLCYNFCMVINMNDDNNNVGNNGNKSRFRDRLNKIRRDKLVRSTSDTDTAEETFLIRGSKNILKIVLALPSVVYNNVKNNKEPNINQRSNSKKLINSQSVKSEIIKNVTLSDNHRVSNKSNDSNSDLDKINERKNKITRIKEMNVGSLKKQRELSLKSNSSVKIENEKDIRKVKLQKEIVDLIKKKLVKNINELEILQSELYLLKEFSGDNLQLKACQEDIKEIKKLLSKIKSLKEKYDYLKDTISFEYMLEYEDNLLIDKILELKELCSSDDIKQTVDDYKILDQYKYLYLKIDKLQDDTIKYEEYKNKQIEELRKRDIDFDELKEKVYDVDREKEKYERFVEEQDRLMKELENKLHNINSYESISFRLKGFNQLLWNSFKFLGLLLINPLKGLMPGIAIQTLMTKNVIHNLYNNLEWEENRKMVYETIDYSSVINMAINDLDSTSSLVDDTLEEILKLKSKYIKDFKQYEYSISSYRDTIKKINKMENAVLGSKIKIELMKQKMKEKEKQNSDKMKKVKKLNSSLE